MAKLGKTAQLLIAQAKVKGRRIIGVERGMGNGAAGGRVKYGDRRWNAALELVEKGYARRVGDVYRTQFTRGGYTIHHSDLVIELREGV